MAHESVHTTLTCPTADCRVSFEVPTGLKDKAIERGQDVFCPNGHRIIWNGGKPRSTIEAEERAEKAEERYEREHRWRAGVEEDFFAEQRAKNVAMSHLRLCPVCGWRTRKVRLDRVVASVANHMISHSKGFEIEHLKDVIEDNGP